MSYVPTNWKSGDVITAAKLNNLEGGVADAVSGSLPGVSNDDNGKTLSVVDGAWAVVDSGAVTPTGTIDVFGNGTYDVAEYANVKVNVSDRAYIGQVTVVNDSGSAIDLCYSDKHALTSEYGVQKTHLATGASATMSAQLMYNQGNGESYVMLMLLLMGVASSTEFTFTPSTQAVSIYSAVTHDVGGSKDVLLYAIRESDSGHASNATFTITIARYSTGK